jgi:hypothetical protein
MRNYLAQRTLIALTSAVLTIVAFVCQEFSPQLSAQVVGATLTGTMLDPSGLAILNGKVSISNAGTGTTTVVATNATGVYSAPNLQPGNYDIVFSAKGFSSQMLRAVTLTVGETRVLNVSMKVGQVKEEVQVSDVAPDVNLADASMGGLNGEQTIKELPLNGRSWTDLANLQPGVFALKTQPDLSSNDRVQRGYGQQISISGGRPTGNNYRIDGINISDPQNAGPGSVLGGNLGVDAVAEFSVLTSSYSAEYGRANGGVLNAITKSGTNQFHGTAYEYLRNSTLDARNFFDLAKPPFRRNQFGASAGGPIKKNKTFIFGDYEGLRQSLSISQVSFVPSVAARQGILSTGNVTVDPQVMRFVNAFYPLPNEVNSVSPDTGILAFGRPHQTTENFFTIRLDQNFSDKDNLHGTYLYDFTDLHTTDEFRNKVTTVSTHRQLVAIAESHIFISSFMNSVRFGFNRYFEGGPASATAINPAASDPSFGFVPGDSAGQVFVAGLTPFSGGLSAKSPQLFHWNTYQVYDDGTLTKGKHSIKFGGSIERDQDNLISSPRPGGIFQFASLSTFLTNQPNNLSTDFAAGRTPRHSRQSIFGLYIVDDFKWRPNLTINLGLRYEPATVPSEIDGKVVSLPTLTAPQPRTGNPLFQNNTLKNFAPRVGISWDHYRDSNTSVRGAFGVYDQLPLIAEMGSTINFSFPFLLSGGLGNLPVGSFPTEAYQLVVNNPGAHRVAYITQNPGRSYVMQWNFGIQREIMPNLAASIGYVGSHGVRGITQTDDSDIVMPIALTPLGYLWPSPAGSGQRINPNVGREPTVLFRNSSIYHGMELQVTKRMSRGIQIQGSYTWSKSIDTASGGTVGDNYVNGISSLFIFDPRLTRALSDFNVGRILSINLLWQAPMPTLPWGFARGVLGGWQMGAIFSAQDGQPFTPFIAGDPLGLNNTDPFAYPDRLATPDCRNLINPGSVNNYIRLQCFSAPNPLTRMGNTGRNSIIGPGLATLDYSLVKNTPIKGISETFNVQFRAEFFNILNRANFAPPIDNATLFDQTGAPIPGAGLIDATTTTSRQIQFALKFIW